MKKVYIECLALVDNHFSGVGQYVLGLLKGIDEVLDNAKYAGDQTYTVKAIVPYDKVNKFKSFGFKHIGHASFPLSFKYMGALWHRGLLPPIDLMFGRGTYVFTRFVKMPLMFSESAVVIYDLSYETYPEFSESRNAKFLKKFVPLTLQKVDAVLTISEFVKKELCSFYNYPDNKVTVAYPATDKSIFYRRGAEEIKLVKEKYDIEGNYILSLSNLEPRKNLNQLVDAYCLLSKNLRDHYSLLLVGVEGWKTNDLLKKIEEKRALGYKIVRPNAYVVDSDKAAILSGASLLVYPSHYEGFGMPPLESLSCGSPVLVARNTSIPEAVGDIGNYFDNSKTENLVRALEDCLKNIKSITNRSVVGGPRYADAFSWQNTGKKVLNILND